MTDKGNEVLGKRIRDQKWSEHEAEERAIEERTKIEHKRMTDQQEIDNWEYGEYSALKRQKEQILAKQQTQEEKRRAELEAALVEMREALEITNDCLFGNTYGDRVLEEAYQVIHQALQERSELK